ncbi:MAG TPA: thiolase family protein [Myxococcota bacterium]
MANPRIQHFPQTDRDPVIVAACRTPIGRIRGVLSAARPDDLLALVFKEALHRANIDGALVDEAYAGCANQAGEDNRNVARMAVLLAGLPESVPAVTVNRLCASGLEAIAQAARQIRCGDADVVLAGGVESMTRAPLVMSKPEAAYASGPPAIFDSSLGWRFPNAKLAERVPLEQMGETAENVVEKFGISREDQDAFALRSHQRAVAAIGRGDFKKEIVAVTIPGKKGDVVVDTDEQPRADSSLEALAKLKPAFRKQGGSVTAGNSSTLNDGASAVVVVSRAFATKHKLRILGVIRGSQSAGVDPRTMGIGPVPATQKLLAKAGIDLGALDAIELNEAFAAQALAVTRGLGLSADDVDNKVNVRGGAIALGHPLGSSGARIVTTLLSILEDTGGHLGVAALCVGVGQGLAMLIERE